MGDIFIIRERVLQVWNVCIQYRVGIILEQTHIFGCGDHPAISLSHLYIVLYSPKHMVRCPDNHQSPVTDPALVPEMKNMFEGVI